MAVTRVAFFDVAGTIVTGEPWRYMLKHPDIPAGRVRAVYARFLPFWVGKRAHLVDDVRYRDRWVREMAGLLKGWSRADTEALFRWIVEDHMREDFYPAIVERAQQHKARGERVVLVSGMFDAMGQHFARHIGADAALGSPLGFDGETCTGRIAGATCAGKRKLEQIQQYLAQNHLPADLTLHYAYADSYSDLPMLSTLGTPTAVYPEAKVREVASAKGWAILD